MALSTCNQDSGCSLTISFYDDLDRPVIPATASYKITDVNSLTSLLADTPISNLFSEVTIEIPPSVNALINQRLDLEPKAVTVTFSFWNGTASVVRGDEYIYSVVRLFGRTNEDNAL